VIRLFHVYYPIRTLILLVGEALIVWTSFLIGAVVVLRDDSYLVLNYENGYLKLFILTGVVLLCSHWFDLYDTSRVNSKGELYFRLLMVPGVLAFVTAGISYVRPNYLLSGYSTALGLALVAFALLGWRMGYSWLVQLPILVERVYVLGSGDRALRLVQGLRKNPDSGIEIASWTGKVEGEVTREAMAAHLMKTVETQKVHRVIVAMADRRGAIPMQELMELRMLGVKVEEATSWLEKLTGKIEVENINPSWLVFSDGFRRSPFFIFLRRLLSICISLAGLLLALPLLPFVMLAIRLDSKGPIFYQQTRVGKNGRLFKVVKFRTMRQDAEAASGAQWAANNDPRVTHVGRFLRFSRLDEIPQLWCVLKGDMAFVGPRPERPEFIEWLSKEIPYYGVRHMVRPGVTGWAQIKYKYGSTIEDAREKLKYDLYYIKNASIGLDFLIMFQTVKTVLLLRGAQ
jgi:sugar transferase (PEP-CTERM system associated)